MDEANLKETLSRISEKIHTPALNLEISGWFDDLSFPKKTRPKKPKKALNTLLTAQKIYLKKPKIQSSHMRKPPSLFEFHCSQSPTVKYKKYPKKLTDTVSRPSTSIKKTNRKANSKYSKIILNKTIVFDSNAAYNRNFSPNGRKNFKKFVRSASSIDEKLFDRGLVVQGSSCNLSLDEKLMNLDSKLG